MRRQRVSTQRVAVLCVLICLFSSAQAAKSANEVDPNNVSAGAPSPVGEASQSQLPSCTYSISPGSQSFPSIGGPGTISVTTQSNCPWTASASAAWVTIDSTASASGSGTLAYSLSANTSTGSRTGHIAVAGEEFSITQAGAPRQHLLTVKKAGDGQGTVSSNPAGTLFNEGTSVTLSAVPTTGSVFSGWSGVCSGTSHTCSIRMNSTASATASFSVKTFTISVSTPSNGIIYPPGPAKVGYGGKRTFQVIPLPGYRVSEVLVDKASVGAVNSYTFQNVTADHLIQATFAKE